MDLVLTNIINFVPDLTLTILWLIWLTNTKLLVYLSPIWPSQFEKFATKLIWYL